VAKIRITKEFNFEMAHALTGYDGPCRNIHGHSYELSVTLLGTPESNNLSPKNGMVIDFSDLKALIKDRIIKIFDHALVLNRNTDSEKLQNLKEYNNQLILVDYQPTSENLLLDFVDRIINLLPSGIELHSLKLRETDTSYSEWYAADNA